MRAVASLCRLLQKLRCETILNTAYSYFRRCFGTIFSVWKECPVDRCGVLREVCSAMVKYGMERYAQRADRLCNIRSTEDGSLLKSILPVFYLNQRGNERDVQY